MEQNRSRGGKASGGRARPRQLTRENAARFQDWYVVERYHLRLPYPEQTFEILSELIVDRPRVVLDVGTGRGEIARPLSEVAERVDAVDVSEAMIERGRRLTGGERVHWILGAAETVELRGPYALITGGQSLHWMDWDVVFARFARLLSASGVVAIVGRWQVATPWDEQLQELISRYSTMRHFEPFNLVNELEQWGVFQKVGERVTAPVRSKQSIDDYINSFHSRSSLSLAAMPVEDARAFNEGLREALSPWAREGMLALETQARVTWGRPSA